MDAEDHGKEGDATGADGRVQRGVRNRQSIVDALYELIRTGNSQPTAKEVAARAGVQRRTVFRHFDHMASLNAELGERLRKDLEPILLSGLYDGTLEERIEATVGNRCDVYVELAPFERVSRAMRLRHSYAVRDHEELVKSLRRHLWRVFPELESTPQPLVAMIEASLSFETWEHLRRDQEQTETQTRLAMASGVRTLFAAAPTLAASELEGPG